MLFINLNIHALFLKLAFKLAKNRHSILLLFSSQKYNIKILYFNAL